MKKKRIENVRIEKEKAERHHLECAIGRSLRSRGVRRVIAGISGGADSVALLCALHQEGIDTLAVHCNFHLRGEESERDRNFVEGLCRRLGVPLEVVEFDVDDYRREHGGSVEMACRELRYERFREIKSTQGADRIAVAHNSDDNAETLLLNLFRGAGITGLAAMREDNGEVIRPLLTFSRREIESYLSEIGESYVTDSSNLESDYRRNYIRNVVLPVVEKAWPGVKDSLNRTAAIMREEEEAISALSEEIRSLRVLKYDEITVPGSGIRKLRRFVIDKGGSHHIAEEILRAVHNKKHNDIHRGALWKSGGGLFVLGRDGLEWLERGIPAEGTEITVEFEIRKHLNSPALMETIKNNRDNLTIWLPLGPEGFRIRTRRGGDRIQPLGMKGSRLVSDIISDAKLTAAQKAATGVLEETEGGEIIWVEGLKRSRKLLVSPDDKIVWEVKRRSEMV
ncbi:MAG: tRNA lysidine(34) synthetase TilS [Muribaculaceae bacterium]|nr:tRNA lysidine(34) synthetase TilS [Muribaculaceae bacterium]